MYFDVNLDKNISYALDANDYHDLFNDTPETHVIEDYLLPSDDMDYNNNNDTILNYLPKLDIDYWMILFIIICVCCVMTIIIFTIM